MSKRSAAIQDSASDRVFYILDWLILIFLLIIVVIPLMNVVSCSMSDPAAVGGGKVYLLPNGFNLDAYRALFREKTIMTGFFNTIYYTFFGTIINIVMTLACAYPLSRKELLFKKPLMLFFSFTMLFSGGMMPT